MLPIAAQSEFVYSAISHWFGRVDFRFAAFSAQRGRWSRNRKNVRALTAQNRRDAEGFKRRYHAARSNKGRYSVPTLAKS